MTHEAPGPNCKIRSRKLRIGIVAAALFVSGAAVGSLLTAATSVSAHERGQRIERVDGESGPRMHRGLQRKLGRALNAVDATDEQRGQAEDIVDAFLNDFEPLHEAHHAQRQALMQALFAEEVDATAVESIRADALETADLMSRELAEGMTALAQVFEPEQRAQIAEFLARHRRGRHH